ncbi:glycosyltransferase family 4 protein [Tardiphaga sp. vice154]|uniref:glycosyltransferase family 4 protein n=1 Tax=Tardiphaga sp. vice154 TaxID=2592814 RepID=UPI001164FDCD|nr:glycosyltransferase family 4 protein [Tardiphaga sp. vice154]QDM22647.1 glycosyltransferase family 4 protein [Tardiphaga sp. vice154]
MAPRVVVFNNMITPYTNRLYNELVERGLDLAVLSCTAQEPDRQWAASISPRYAHHVVPGLTLPISRSRFTHINFGISRALRKLEPDILFLNGFFPSMLAAALWATTHGRTLALTMDGWAETMPDTLYHRVVRPWILARCQAIVSCSRKGRAYFHDRGMAAEQLALIPLVPAWDAPIPVPGGDRAFDILWCARINDGAKNAAFFEDVVVALHTRRPHLTVRIVGTGPAEQRMMARFAAAGIEVSHDRYLPWQAMAGMFGQCRVLMLTSLLEPWGLVCNEAMQCGVPCIVSRHVGAADELVRDADTGFVCDLAVADWVEVAGRLLDDRRLWNEMSAHARRAAGEVTIEASASSFLKVVERLAQPLPRERGAAHA